MGSINYFDYKLLVEETIKNYCSNLGLLYPTNFKKMDTTQQTKLTKSEWESVEVPVSEDEKRVLTLILTQKLIADLF